MKNKSEIIIYQTQEGETKIDVRIDGSTVWLSLMQISELFQRDKSVISRHIKNIFEESELEKNSVVANFATTASDGKIYDVDFFNLDVIISVGYRVKSLRGTQFRIWATKRLNEYIIKGFTMNDELLKKAGGGNYFDELLERIRDIRSSEKVFWRKVLDIFSTSVDYSPKEMPEYFFEMVQNKMHWAAHGHTASEIIMLRADATKPNMGMTVVSGKKPKKSDTTIAKNYLNQEELEALNLLVSSFLDIAELQARRRIVMYMKDWLETLDSFLKMSRSDILRDAGRISREIANQKAQIEYEKYKQLTDDELSSIERDYIAELEAAKDKLQK
ncbi:MAG: virulence RhuM family protein [bacterium]